MALLFFHFLQQSPLGQLRKASSVQSLQSPKKKYECLTILGELHLPLTLGPRFVVSANVMRIQNNFYRILTVEPNSIYKYTWYR